MYDDPRLEVEKLGMLPVLGAKQPIDPMLRRRMMAQALSQGGGQAPIPQYSPTGAAMTGFANGLNMGGNQNIRDAFASMFGGNKSAWK